MTYPAAFGRLCVETERVAGGTQGESTQPPSGGCVLKLRRYNLCLLTVMPAAFGRLCVETIKHKTSHFYELTSRLRAAVC